MSEDEVGHACSGSHPSTAYTSHTSQFDEDYLDQALPQSGIANPLPSTKSPIGCGLDAAGTCPVQAVTHNKAPPPPHHGALYADIPIDIWPSAEMQGALPVSANCFLTGEVNYNFIPGGSDILHGPGLWPTDQLGSQEPYPNALEVSPNDLAWTPSIRTVGTVQQSNVIIFPSVAPTLPSTQVYTQELLLPFGYDPVPLQIPSGTNWRAEQEAPHKRRRKGGPPSAEFLHSKPSKQHQTSYEHQSAVQHMPYITSKWLSDSCLSHPQDLNYGYVDAGTSSSPWAAKGDQHNGLNDSSDASRDSSSTASFALNPLKKRPARRGPLTQCQKDRVEAVRHQGACWRCRRYKKPVGVPNDEKSSI
jgi:hypothetical protein